MKNNAILLCRCKGDKFDSLPFDDMSLQLKSLNVHLYQVEDLCAGALVCGEQIKSLADKHSRLFILACYPRAVKNLLLQNGIDLNNYITINIRHRGLDNSISQLLRYGIVKGEATLTSIMPSLNVPAWYPVIDQSRCNGCGGCAKFCLFGTYSIEGEKVKVENPLNCKNNCPACARTCPESAIIFPKVADDPIIAGEEPVPKSMEISSKPSESQEYKGGQIRSSILRGESIRMAEEQHLKALNDLRNRQNGTNK